MRMTAKEYKSKYVDGIGASESDIQIACVGWFKRCTFGTIDRLLYAIPNGGLRRKTTAKRLKKRGCNRRSSRSTPSGSKR